MGCTNSKDFERSHVDLAAPNDHTLSIRSKSRSNENEASGGRRRRTLKSSRGDNQSSRDLDSKTPDSSVTSPPQNESQSFILPDIGGTVNSLDPSQMQQMLFLFNDTNTENLDPRVHKVKKSFASLKAHYDVESKTLGTGISGDVRLGRGKVTERKVAIKTLDFDADLDDYTKTRLLNEIFIYLSVDHPNIVRLYDVYIGKDEINLVMEYAEGGELYKNLLSRKSYKERDAAELVTQMLSALVYLHSEKICHRDLKLENWVYATKEPDSKIRLIDFGFARIFNERNPMRAPLGSIYYVSPEILTMKPYDEKTDMWSLGVIVYMMLCGKPPFHAEKDFQTLSLIIKSKVEFPEESWQRISPEAKDFVLKLLQKRPDRRMSAAEAMNHPWIKESGQNGQESTIDGKVFRENEVEAMVDKMRDYLLRTEAYRHASNYIAKRVPGKFISDIEDVFSGLDSTSTGVIEYEEWKCAMDKLGVDRTEGGQLFNSIDVHGTGVISYSAFIASMNCFQTLNDSILKASYQKLSADVKRTDHLTEDDFIHRFGDEMGRQIFHEIVHCWNNCVETTDCIEEINPRKHVNYDMFRKFMMTGGILKETRPEEEEEVTKLALEMEACVDKQRAWDKLAGVCRPLDRAETDQNSATRTPPTSPMTPPLYPFETFHLARGHSF